MLRLLEVRKMADEEPFIGAAPQNYFSSIGASVLLAYLVGPAILLVLFLQVDLVVLASRLRILDLLADMGIVQVTDPGTGIFIVGMEVYEFARQPIRYAVAAISFLLVLVAMIARAVRHQLIAYRNGVGEDVGGKWSSYFVGRGMDQFLPFGPGEFGSARMLERNGADSEAASGTAYYSRIFEVSGGLAVLGIGLGTLGWQGAFIPVVLTLLFLWVIARFASPKGNLPKTAKALRVYFRKNPYSALILFLVSLFAIFAEVTGLWFLKQAFSTREFVLLGDITYLQFVVVLAAASFIRAIPFTPGAFGIYEGLIVSIFHLGFGQSILPGLAVAIIDTLLLTLVTTILFLYAIHRHDTNVWHDWRTYLGLGWDSEARDTSPGGDEVVGGDAPATPD